MKKNLRAGAPKKSCMTAALCCDAYIAGAELGEEMGLERLGANEVAA